MITRRRHRPRTEAMTLVEVMIVVGVAALIASAVGLAVVPRIVRARADVARVDAVSVAHAALAFSVERASDSCPSVADLVHGGFLAERTRATDPWGHDFAIECAGPEPSVRSAGADGAFGTGDDVSTTP